MTFIDLTLPIAPGMPFNPDHFPPDISSYASIASHGWRASRLVLDSHLGTYIDAPNHFVEGGKALDELDLASLIGPAQIVHLRVWGRVRQSRRNSYPQCTFNACCCTPAGPNGHCRRLRILPTSRTLRRMQQSSWRSREPVWSGWTAPPSTTIPDVRTWRFSSAR